MDDLIACKKQSHDTNSFTKHQIFIYMSFCCRWHYTAVSCQENSFCQLFRNIFLPRLTSLRKPHGKNLSCQIFCLCIKTETTNIIERRLIKNSKGLKVTDCNTEQSKHSFFVETIVHWNRLGRLSSSVSSSNCRIMLVIDPGPRLL
jgi:hypothetical protein